MGSPGINAKFSIDFWNWLSDIMIVTVPWQLLTSIIVMIQCDYHDLFAFLSPSLTQSEASNVKAMAQRTLRPEISAPPVTVSGSVTVVTVRPSWPNCQCAIAPSEGQFCPHHNLKGWHWQQPPSHNRARVIMIIYCLCQSPGSAQARICNKGGLPGSVSLSCFGCKLICSATKITWFCSCQEA